MGADKNTNGTVTQKKSDLEMKKKIYAIHVDIK
jgi:hypothetical protein